MDVCVQADASTDDQGSEMNVIAVAEGCFLCPIIDR
jgi:hypothetical protein